MTLAHSTNNPSVIYLSLLLLRSKSTLRTMIASQLPVAAAALPLLLVAPSFSMAATSVGFSIGPPISMESV